jgi:4-hydroxy-tetrahydrodipicolinate reductase
MLNEMDEGAVSPRLAFYGLGNYGLEAVRIAHAAGVPIAAAYNRAGPKVGQDLGRLAGLGTDIGVIVQDCDTADYATSGVNVAIVAVTDRLSKNMPVYEQLLGAGINIICHGAEAYFPYGADPELAARIDALARANGVSFTGTGIWDFSRIWAGILAVGPSTQLRALKHYSVTNAQSATLDLAKVCGVTLTQQEFAEQNYDRIGDLYKLIPHHVLHALGYTVTKVTEHREPVLSEQPVYSHLAGRDLEPGIALGIRIVAEVETAEGVTATSHMELRILNEGESEHMLWELDGKPATKVRVDRTDSVHTSAACLVHRVPDVLAAAPGIRLVSQLGVLRPTKLAL